MRDCCVRQRWTKLYALFVMLAVCQTGTHALVDTLRHSDVKNIAQAFSNVFNKISCESMRTGLGCDTIGLQQVHAAVQQSEAGFSQFRVNPQRDWLDQAVQEVSNALEGAELALRKMASDIEQYLIERLIIEGLTQIDHDKLPAFDASHPHWLEDLTSTEVENTEFFVPVGQSSVLHYPKGVNRDDRQVKVSANASVGLEENFMLNVATMDDESPSGASIRWQRFTSKTGVTRSYPAAYDDSAKDHRFEPWFKLCTQVRKKVLIVLDVSETMRSQSRFQIAKQVIATILRSITPEDFVQVMLTSGRQAVLPSCDSQHGLYPSSEETINHLLLFLDSIEIGGGLDVLGTLGAALEMMGQERDCPPQEEEEEEQEDEPQEEQSRCRERHTAIFFISDGEFESEKLEEWLLGNRLQSDSWIHLMGVAVGTTALESPVQDISCALNGIFFRVQEDRGPSATRSLLDDWYQLLAAPLATRRPLDVTWTLPQTEATGNEVHVTWSLPAFTDEHRALPQLVGAVSIDLAFVTSPQRAKKSLFPVLSALPLFDPKSRQPQRSPESSLIFTRGYAGVPLLNKHLGAVYARGLPLSLPASARAASMAAYQDDTFREERVLERIVTEGEGAHAALVSRCNSFRPQQEAAAKDWDLRATHCEPRNVTYVWRKMATHPLTIVLELPLLPDARNGSSFWLEGWERDTPLIESVQDCSFAAERDSDVKAALEDGNRTCTSPLTPSSFSIDPLFFSLSSAGAAAEASWLLLPHSCFVDTFEYLKSMEGWGAGTCIPSGTHCSLPPSVQALVRALSGSAEESEAARTLGEGVRRQCAHDVASSALLERLWSSPAPPSRALARARFVATPAGVLRGRVGGGVGGGMPRSFSAASSAWFQRALDSRGKLSVLPPSASSFCAGPSSCPRVLTLSAAVEDAAVAVVGAEVELDALQRQLVRASSFTGSRNVSCGVAAYRGEVRCYLVNRAGAVLLSPGRDSTREAAGEGAVFLGLLEPDLTDSLVKRGLLVPRAVEQPEILGGPMLAYDADEGVLPMVAVQLTGLAKGSYHVTEVAGVDAFLIVIDNYLPGAAGTARAPHCQGVLAVCDPTVHPMLAPDVVLPCQRELVVVTAAVDVMLREGKAAVLKLLRVKDLCKVPHPTWVPILASLAFTALFVLLSLRAVRGRMKQSRQHSLHAAALLGEDDEGAAQWSERPAPEGLDRPELLRQVNQTREEVDSLLERAVDEEDTRMVIRQQGLLMRELAGARHTMAQDLTAQLEREAVEACRKCVLADNLSARILQVEQLTPSTAAVRAARAGAETAVAQMEEALGDLALPALHVVEDRRLMDAKGSTELRAEQDFYGAFYPHLIQYQTLNADHADTAERPTSRSPRCPSPRAAHPSAPRTKVFTPFAVADFASRTRSPRRPNPAPPPADGLASPTINGAGVRGFAANGESAAGTAAQRGSQQQQSPWSVWRLLSAMGQAVQPSSS